MSFTQSRCCVVNKMEDGKMNYSLRASQIGGSKDCVEDPEVETISDLSKGQVLRGYVKAVTDVGVFVRYIHTLCCYCI